MEAVEYEAVLEYKGLRLFWVFGRISPVLQRQLVQFWAVNGAIADPFEAWKRTFQVGYLVLNAADEIVGVNSVYPEKLPFRNDEPWWLYRTFIRHDGRVSGLASRMLRLTLKRLTEYSRGPGAPIGLALVAENEKLARAGARRKIERLGFVSAGGLSNGAELWLSHFERW